MIPSFRSNDILPTKEEERHTSLNTSRREKSRLVQMCSSPSVQASLPSSLNAIPTITATTNAHVHLFQSSPGSGIYFIWKKQIYYTIHARKGSIVLHYLMSYKPTHLVCPTNEPRLHSCDVNDCTSGMTKFITPTTKRQKIKLFMSMSTRASGTALG